MREHVAWIAAGAALLGCWAYLVARWALPQTWWALLVATAIDVAVAAAVVLLAVRVLGVRP